MDLDRRALVMAGGDAGGGACGAHTLPPGPSQPDATIDLWPNGAPGAPATPPVETIDERSGDPFVPDRAVHGISRPRLAVFRPERPNGAAVLLTPGGGYRRVVIDREGYEMARWLAARGFTAFVLFYRLPGEGWASGPDTPLADAQRAMRLIRHRAQHYALSPARVAAMGFSAGGHVCADLAARFAAKLYRPVDAADALSARPLCAAPIYPVVSMDRNYAHPGSRTLLIRDDDALAAAHSPDLNVTGDSPPCFLVHAEDDDVVPVANSLMFRAALRARGIAVETHLFATGGHGFGLRGAAGKPVEAWPDLWRAWARTTGLG